MKVEHHDDAEFVKWYRRLGSVEQAKVTWQLDLLMAVGAALGMPHVRDLGGGLGELRIRAGQQPRLYSRSKVMSLGCSPTAARIRSSATSLAREDG
jgi:putative component of toxin-antitoxin plasmid stabilization module